MKKKGLLISLSAVACSAIAISAACLASKHVKIFNSFNASNTLVRNDAFEVDTTNVTEVDTEEYTAVATDDKGNQVNTRFVGFTHDSNGFKIPANKNIYFTNTEPMRGISDIHFSIDVADDYEPNFAYVVYGSSNSLVYEDIFNGYYYDDLQFYYNHFYDYHVDEFNYASYYSAPSLTGCHYMMVIICNLTSDVLPIEEISFTATCAAEPDTKSNVQATTYKEASEMSTKGVPAYFPYLKTNGYTYNLEVDYGLQLGMVNTTVNAEIFFDAAMTNGYEYIDMQVPGVNMFLFQKQTGATTALTMYLQYEILNSSLLYGAFVYSDQIPYQGAPTYDSWPASVIEEYTSEALSLAFPAVTITDAVYKVYERPNNGLYKAVYVDIQAPDAANEFIEYIENLDTNIYIAVNDYNDHYTIETIDGRFSMTGNVSNNMELELIEYNQYEHLPANAINTALGRTVLPVSTDFNDIDGTFMCDGSIIKASFADNDGFYDLRSVFINEEYIYQGNSNVGCIIPYLMEKEDFGHTALQYTKVGTNEYNFSFISASIMEKVNFNEAVAQSMHEAEGSLAPLTYTDTVSYVAFEQAVSLKYIYMKNTNINVLQDIYDSIDVSTSNKACNTSANTISYIYEYETGKYAIIRLLFKVVDSDIYVFTEYEDRGNDSTFNDLADGISVIGQLSISGSYCSLPAGERYLKTGPFSLCYISDELDAHQVAGYYRATLTSQGYTCIDEYNGLYQAPAGYSAVRMYLAPYQSATILYIDFYDYSSFMTGYQNYTDAFENHAQSTDVLAMLALFPDVFTKNASKHIYTNVYYSGDKYQSLSFDVDAFEFSAGVIGQRLMNEFGYMRQFGTTSWGYSLSFAKVDNSGNRYEISFYPSRSMAFGEFGDIFSVRLEYIPHN